MKKIVSIFIIVLSLFYGSSVFAAENGDTTTTIVTYVVPESFKWTAPTDVTFDAADEIKTSTLVVSENIIPYNSFLVISIPEQEFVLTSSEGATRNYKVYLGENELTVGSEVLRIPAGTKEGSVDLNFKVPQVENIKAGTYTGTLNFTAKVKEPVNVSKGQIVTLSDLGYTDVDLNEVGHWDDDDNWITDSFGDDVADTFRVLSVDGNNVTLLAMERYKKAYFGSNNTYSGSTIDTEMTNYYNALPSDVKSAIVAQNINQGTYRIDKLSTGSDILHVTYLDGNSDYYANTATTNIGSRNVFALDIQDIADYLDSDITAAELNEMFFNTSKAVSRNDWLRSASAYDGAFSVYGFNGDFGYNLSGSMVDEQCGVVPAFVINLG